MIKENNPLLKLKFSNQKSKFIELYTSLSESLYTLFDLILENPIEIFWLECFYILSGYFQLILFTLDSTVRL